MTQVRRVRGVAAVLATLAAATLATTAQDNAHAATGDGSGTGKHPTTKLRVHVTGCDACSLQLQHAVNGKAHVWTSSRQRIGADHVAAFTVRTSRTHGLSFVIRAPWEGNTGAVSNIVTRYSGQSIDHHVTRFEPHHRGRRTR